MKILLRVLIALSLCNALGAPLAAQPARLRSDTALATMVAAERAYAQLALDSTTQHAFDRYFADDGVVFRPRALAAREYFRTAPMPAGLVRLWEPSYADASAAGDLGYTTGQWMSSRTDGAQGRPSFGQYVTVWRRQSDGSWKVAVDAGIGHGPDIGPGDSLRTAPPPEYHAAAGADTAQLRRSLMAADSAFAALSEKEGPAHAFRVYAAAQIRLLRSGWFPVLGVDNVARSLDNVTHHAWTPQAARVAASGDLGYTRGAYSLVGGSAGLTVRQGGDYLRVWRRAADGSWRVALDLSSADPRGR